MCSGAVLHLWLNRIKQECFIGWKLTSDIYRGLQWPGQDLVKFLQNSSEDSEWMDLRVLLTYRSFILSSYTSVSRTMQSEVVTKGLSSQGYSFSSSHVWMWELDSEESWVPKNWCFWTVVLEKTLESPLDCKKIQPVHPKGDQSWMFIGRTDVEAETPVLGPPHAKSWHTRKDPNAGKDWGQEKKGTTEDEIAGWHQWLHGHGFG